MDYVTDNAHNLSEHEEKELQELIDSIDSNCMGIARDGIYALALRARNDLMDKGISVTGLSKELNKF